MNEDSEESDCDYVITYSLGDGGPVGRTEDIESRVDNDKSALSTLQS